MYGILSLKNCPAIIEAKETHKTLEKFLTNDLHDVTYRIGKIERKLSTLLWIVPVSISLVSGIVVGLLKLFR
jgi:hypothetical protein